MTYMEYAESAVEGRITVGELTRLACKRFLDDLQRDDLEFREKEVKRCIAFAGLFHHYKGAHSGQRFKLEPWQEFIVANIVGFYLKGTNRRRFTSSYIEVSRKNGKSFLAAFLCVYFATMDGEDGAEALLAANTREQAIIAFSVCRELCSQLDSKQKDIRPFKTWIDVSMNHSTLKVLAADARKLDGYNASFGLIDEYHEAPTSKVRDVIRSSMGMRTKPHLCTITTAGFNLALPCYKMRCNCVDLLRGNITDDATFAVIYELDEGDDWRDERNWIKANPNLGVTVVPQFLREEVKKAMNDPSEEVGVKTKLFDIWCNSAETWIDDDIISRSMEKMEWKEFADQSVFCGVDLAAVSDLTALAVLRQDKDGKARVKIEYYLPSEALKNGLNAERYRDWYMSGYLNITDGNVTDYDAVTRRLEEISESGVMHGVAYDSWNATQWAVDATQRGLPLQPFAQNIGNFNRPTKELERRLLNGSIKFDYNPITRWCFQNVIVKVDGNGNEKPSKAKREQKIDGVIAAIQAIGLWVLTPNIDGDMSF